MMTSRLNSPKANQQKENVKTLVCQILIGLLLLGFLSKPFTLQAQTLRRQDDRRREEKPKRQRSNIDAFSQSDIQLKEEELGNAQVQIDVGHLSKAAYDAVIRSGRYIIGPGDIFISMLEQEDLPEVQEIIVGADGNLIIPFVGTLPVAGLTLRETNSAIQFAIQNRFQHFEIYINLAHLRTFSVNVLGEVRWPGTYMVHGVESVSTLIMRAGGLLKEPEGKSSLRNIKVERILTNGNIEETDRKADLALWRLTGNIAHNPFLLDGDLIIVPVRGDSINVTGAVHRAGNYEYSPGDRISDLIRLGGGLIGPIKTSKAELLRLPKNGNPSKRTKINLMKTLTKDSMENLELQAGDKLYVEGKEHRVTIEGQVRFPGAFPIRKGLTLKELINQAGSFTSLASLAQASVIRQVEYENREDEDLVLNRLLDRPAADLTDEERAVVTMKTQQVPGRLPVDFIALFEGKEEKHNIPLKGGDIIRVPRLVNSVIINGFVITPGAIPYDSTYVVDDYIARAGGFNARAKKEGVVVIKASTGNSVNASKVDRLDPGDAIYVPPEPPGQGYRLFRETLAVLSQIATLILTIRAIQ